MSASVRRVDRYDVFEEIASGGMAAVHLARQHGPAGASRVVAAKRLHAQFVRDPNVVRMLLDEARLVARITHPNVVPLLDVVQAPEEVLLILEYVHGESLSKALAAARQRRERVPVAIASAIVQSLLRGLHAAHEATDEAGLPLGVVHRDVSPQNVLVGRDGIVRLVDFGIAKARGLLHETREETLKGKLAYMAPEQARGRELGPRTDVYSASVVLWELLAGRILFSGAHEGAVLEQVLLGDVALPSRYAPDLSEELDAIALRGLSLDPTNRYPSALAMAEALEAAAPPADASAVGAWLSALAHDALAGRDELIRRIEAREAPPPAPARHGARARAAFPRFARRSAVGVAAAIAALVAALALAAPRADAVRSPEGEDDGKRTVAVTPVDRARPLPRSEAPMLAAHAPEPLRAPAEAAEVELIELDDDAPPRPAAAPARTASAPRLEPARTGKGRALRADCSPPYTRDALGRKIYKLRCIDP